MLVGVLYLFIKKGLSFENGVQGYKSARYTGTRVHHSRKFSHIIIVEELVISYETVGDFIVEEVTF